MFAPRSDPLLLLLTGVTAVSMFFVPLSWYVLIPFGFFAIATLFLMFFFRDPNREAPKEEGIFVSPTDGRVIEIIELENKTTQVQVQLSVFNAHVNRAPIDCEVISLQREKGRHWPVWFKKKYVKQNARLHFSLRSKEGFSFRVTQIAGIFAWRCVSYVSVGDSLKQNDKIGIIRFGSQANIELPKDCGYSPTVKVGDKVRAGETIIARRK